MKFLFFKKKSRKEIIKEISARILNERNCINSARLDLKTTTDPETIAILRNDMQAHRISLFTLKDLLKSIE